MLTFFIIILLLPVQGNSNLAQERHIQKIAISTRSKIAIMPPSRALQVDSESSESSDDDTPLGELLNLKAAAAVKLSAAANLLAVSGIEQSTPARSDSLVTHARDASTGTG